MGSEARERKQCSKKQLMKTHILKTNAKFNLKIITHTHTHPYIYIYYIHICTYILNQECYKENNRGIPIKDRDKARMHTNSITV